NIREMRTVEDQILRTADLLRQQAAERDAHSRQREKTRIALEAAHADLESFTYSVSHDLRAPLRAVAGFSRILLDDHAGKLDTEGQRLLGVVIDGTAGMGRMIEAILTFSRTGRAELKMTTVD